MNAVTTHGEPKITMDSQERDYQERLRQARAQGDGNPYTVGISGSREPEPEPTAEPEAPAFSAEQPREEEPNQMGSDALDKRLALYAEARGNADFGNNDRSQTMRG